MTSDRVRVRVVLNPEAWGRINAQALRLGLKPQDVMEFAVCSGIEAIENLRATVPMHQTEFDVFAEQVAS